MLICIIISCFHFNIFEENTAKCPVYFNKNWTFLIQLIGVSKEENNKLTYPHISRKEGIGPSQYGIKSILGDRFADVEEKYDLAALGEGFGDEGEEAPPDEDGAEEDDASQDESAF